MTVTLKIKGKSLNTIEQSYIFRNPHKLYEQKWEIYDRLTEDSSQPKKTVL